MRYPRKSHIVALFTKARRAGTRRIMETAADQLKLRLGIRRPLGKVVMPVADIETCPDQTILSARLRQAMRQVDIRSAYAIRKRLKDLQGDHPTAREAAQMGKIAARLPEELAALDLVQSVSPRPVSPVADRICYFLHNSMPYASGGYATRAHGLAKALGNAGYDVIATTRPGFPVDVKDGMEPGTIADRVEIDGVTYARIIEPSRKSHRLAAYLRASADAMEARLREDRPSVVIAASNHYTGLPALIAARRVGIPFVYEVRGFWEVTRHSREPDFIYSRSYALQSFMEAEICRQADHVFTLTGAMKNELLHRDVPGTHVALLPNAVDPDRFVPCPGDEALAQELLIPDGVPVIGYIGSFVQYEGLDHLAQACGLLKARGVAFRLLIVGNEDVSGTGLGPIATGIRQIAESHGFLDWLIMPGRVPHDRVAHYYSLIDIAPFPRKPQPVTEMVSPMKPLEALAMEKAVLVSSVEALAEMIRDGVTGMIFEKGNIADLAGKLETLTNNPGLRRTLGKTGRTWVIENRTWARTAAIADTVLKDLTAMRDGPKTGSKRTAG